MQCIFSPFFNRKTSEIILSSFHINMAQTFPDIFNTCSFTEKDRRIYMSSNIACNFLFREESLNAF
jgi:hypothetical protein